MALSRDFIMICTDLQSLRVAVNKKTPPKKKILRLLDRMQKRAGSAFKLYVGLLQTPDYKKLLAVLDSIAKEKEVAKGGEGCSSAECPKVTTATASSTLPS